MGTKKTYTAEFKQEVASLVLDNDYTITQAYEAMGGVKVPCGLGETT